MPLGTLDRTPPPFFRQGPSALTRLVFFSALALFTMAADTRWQLTTPLRSVVATALLPVQRVLMVPVQMWNETGDYLQGLRHALNAEDAARTRLAAQAERVSQVEQLAAENRRLRALLELKPALRVRSLPAEVLYEAADPYSRKLLIDRGATQGVVAGSPVMSEAGVLGQVTRVYPLHAEVTLLVDKDAAIPVMNARTQARSAAFGAPAGAESSEMELRFMPGNADVQVGDALVTSGVDGIYPPGLAVAQIARIDRRADSAFARITLQPAAHPDGVRHVLVLEPVGRQLPAWPNAESAVEPLPASAPATRGAANSAAAKAAPAPSPAAKASGPAAAAKGTAPTASGSVPVTRGAAQRIVRAGAQPAAPASQGASR